MTAVLQPGVLFGLCGAVLVGIGLFAIATSPVLLRRIVGCNILGVGIFLVFGAVARRGGGAGLEADPVPQALVITGIVVAFSASALAVALLKRLSELSAGDRAGTAAPAEPRSVV